VFLSSLIYRVSFLPFAFRFLLGTFRFIRLLDFEFIQIFNVVCEKKRKGEKNHSPCKVIERIVVLISFFNVCVCVDDDDGDGGGGDDDDDDDAAAAAAADTRSFLKLLRRSRNVCLCE